MSTRNFYQPLLPFDELEETGAFEASSNLPLASGDPNSVRGGRQYPIEFRYWLDERASKRDLSRQWLACAIEGEEVYLDEKGKERRKVLVRAEAYSEQQIIRRIYGYGDKAELISPPELREKMRQEVERMHSFYQK